MIYHQKIFGSSGRSTKNDTLMVKTPSDFWGDEVYINGEKGHYTNLPSLKDSDYKDHMATITVHSGKSEFYVDIQFRKRIISYSLYLINNRTGEEKIIEG